MPVPKRYEQAGAIRGDGKFSNIIDYETMEYVCILSKLSLSGQETEKAKADMQKMLDYVEKLDELDTSGLVTLSHIFVKANEFRQDVVTNGHES